MDSISIREAADRLGVSHKVIRRLVSQGTLEAHKRPGPHGTEWRVDVASLIAYQKGDSVPRHGSSSRVRLPSTPAQPAHLESRADADDCLPEKAFLQEQVTRLTELLARAITSQRPADALGGTGEAAQRECPDVTASLQSSLRAVQHEGIAAIELCSVKVLWGRPVLWRVAATEAADVAHLLDAVLSADAHWAPPGEEVVFIWALGSERNVVWGTACGPGWFGPGFEEALRRCRVERR